MVVSMEVVGGLSLLVSLGFLALGGADLVRASRRVATLERQAVALRARIEESLDVRVP